MLNIHSSITRLLMRKNTCTFVPCYIDCLTNKIRNGITSTRDIMPVIHVVYAE